MVYDIDKFWHPEKSAYLNIKSNTVQDITIMTIPFCADTPTTQTPLTTTTGN